MDSLADMRNQIDYLQNLCDYLNATLSDLKAIEVSYVPETPRMHGLIHAATNRQGGQIKNQLDHAMMNAQAWVREVREIINGQV